MGNCQVEPKRVGQVEEQMMRFDEAISRLDTLVDSMEQVLVPIIRDEDMDPGVENKEEILVTVASSIKSKTNRIKNYNRRLSSLLDRIEL